MEPREEPSRPNGGEGFVLGERREVVAMTDDDTGTTGVTFTSTCLLTDHKERTDV